MTAVNAEDLQPLSPDAETDLAEMDTDERERQVANQATVIIDEDADQWDRMLGLDVVPDGQALPDQVPAKSNLGLWIALGLVFGVGVVWSLGLFPTSGEQEAPTEVNVVTPPPVVPAVAPPAPRAPTPADSVSPAAAPEPVEEETPAPQPELAAEPEPVAPVTAPPEPVPPAAVVPPAVVPPPEAPVTPPEPAPQTTTPAPAPAGPQTGLVRVAGDAHQVRLVRAGRRYSGGRLPPGDYRIEVTFRQGEASRVAGRLSVDAGDRKLVRCAADFYRCQVR